MDEAELQVVGLVREIGEEARNLGKSVARVLSALEKNPPDNTEIAASVQDADAIAAENRNEIESRLEQVRADLSAHPDLRNDYGDSETRLTNLWRDAERRWHEPNRTVATFRATDQILNELVLEAAYVSIPPRLDENLEDYRIGGALNFEKEFGDEVNAEQRAAILEWLNSHARSVAGIVDVTRGVVFKAHKSAFVRGMSYASILVVAAIGVALPYLRDEFNLQDLLVPKIASDGDLAHAVGLGLLGLVIHVLVSGFKEVRRAASEHTAAPSLGSWLLDLHVRYLAATAAVAAVVIAVMFAAQSSGKTDPLTMLAVGYGADSIMDALLPKALSQLSSRTEIVGKMFS
jgi:hypothetical protein